MSVHIQRGCSFFALQFLRCAHQRTGGFRLRRRPLPGAVADCETRFEVLDNRRTKQNRPAAADRLSIPLRVRPLVVLACYCCSLLVLGRWPVAMVGGAEEIRTPDLRLAKAALSQLSYGPSSNMLNGQYATPLLVAAISIAGIEPDVGWWAILDSNQRPQSYQDCALTS